MKRIVVLLILSLLVLVIVSLWVFAESEDYRLDAGDTLRLYVWTWGNQPVQQIETTVRPDGKLVLSIDNTYTGNYHLGAGDVLAINVWGYDELKNSEVIVRPDGKFSFPLIGEIEVSSLTPGELNEKMIALLSNYVKEPKVTVNLVKFRLMPVLEEFDAKGLTLHELTAKVIETLKQNAPEAKATVEIVKYRSTRVYVLGEVAKPGLCEIEKSHNLLDAIGAAGGFTKGANRKKVYLIRNGQTDKYIVVNLEQLLKKGDLSQNYLLNEGDTIYLGRTGIDYVKDILPFITAIYQINKMD